MNSTSWTLYASNEEAWEDMLKDCAKAEKSIVLEQYIFVMDDFGKKLIDICAERASKGVRVRFLWDAAGSFSFFGSNIVQELKERGIELIFWKTLMPDYSKTPNWQAWFLRNHRRTLVIDDKVGFTGSMCVDDQMKNWRDTNVRLQSLVVTEMSNAFERMWQRATKSKVLAKDTRVRDREFRYVTNYPSPGRRHIHSELIGAIRNAKKYIYITTPYFVPTGRLLRVIKLAARRGVDVKIILPKDSNWSAVDIGARSYFTTLLESKVKILLYTGNMIHAKTTVIDGDWSTVGTMNLDRISLLYNFEANIITTNARFAEELVAHFVYDMKNTEEVTLDQWRKRSFIERLPEIAIRLVRKFL